MPPSELKYALKILSYIFLRLSSHFGTSVSKTKPVLQILQTHLYVIRASASIQICPVRFDDQLYVEQVDSHQIHVGRFNLNTQVEFFFF